MDGVTVIANIDPHAPFRELTFPIRQADTIQHVALDHFLVSRSMVPLAALSAISMGSFDD